MTKDKFADLLAWQIWRPFIYFFLPTEAPFCRLKIIIGGGVPHPLHPPVCYAADYFHDDVTFWASSKPCCNLVLQHTQMISSNYKWPLCWHVLSLKMGIIKICYVTGIPFFSSGHFKWLCIGDFNISSRCLEIQTYWVCQFPFTILSKH